MRNSSHRAPPPRIRILPDRRAHMSAPASRFAKGERATPHPARRATRDQKIERHSGPYFQRRGMTRFARRRGGWIRGMCARDARLRERDRREAHLIDIRQTGITRTKFSMHVVRPCVLTRRTWLTIARGVSMDRLCGSHDRARFVRRQTGIEWALRRETVTGSCRKCALYH